MFVVGSVFGAWSGDLGDGDGVDGFVELAVPAAVEAVTYDSSGTGEVPPKSWSVGYVVSWVFS